jgi:uncharacterized protein
MEKSRDDWGRRGEFTVEPAVENGEGRPQLAGVYDFFRRRPILSVIVLWGAELVVTNLTTLVTKNVAPWIQPPDVTALIVASILIAVVLTALGWWRTSGFNRPARWRELGLLILPLILMVVLPLVAGVQPLDPGTLVFLVTAELLTGFHEEAVYRGLLLRIPRPGSPWRAVLVTSILFGLAHLSNLQVRNPAIVLAQAVGAFSSGFGMAALRLRTNTLWPLILIHFCEDLFLRFTPLPVIPVNVVQSVVMLLYGLYLLRDRRKLQPEPPLQQI